jgi:(p)ppGpp synthase/HD superfamily hydrolase
MSATPASPRASTGGWRRCAASCYSGQTVEIINAPGAKPNAVLAQLRRHRQGARQRPRLSQEPASQEAEALGRRMLNAELARFGLDVDSVGESVIAVCARGQP